MTRPVHLHLRDVASVCAKARRLIRKGFDPEAMVYAWRGTTLCLHPMPLRYWAGLTVEEGDSGLRFRRYRPMPDAMRRQGREVASQTAVVDAEVGV